MPVISIGHSHDSDDHRERDAAPAQRLRQVAPTRLTSSAAELFGRGQLLRKFEKLWANPQVNVVTLVAFGGVGKTALVADWTMKLAGRDCDGADYFDWSFYSQGTREQGNASADTFIDAALRHFGDDALADSARSAWDKGSGLAATLATRRALLVLDGLEPLQHPPGPLAGDLKDQGLLALLRGLAARNAGLCVVTTRERVADLKKWEKSGAFCELPLENLPLPAAVDFLKSLGVHGSKADLEAAVKEVQGHALSLGLIGRYVARALGGDVRKRDLIDLPEDAPKIKGGSHAFRAMATYEKWLAGGGEATSRQLAVLRLLGLFDRPAANACLAELRKAPAIAGLTESLVELPEADWQILLQDLADCRLVHHDEKAVDAHPLIREYFATRLDRAAWREAHGRLFDFLKGKTEQFPDTLAGLQPLYQAVYHGCQAGRWQEACDRVYFARIQRGREAFSTKKLGAIGADLGAVACFFEKPWSQVASALSEGDQAWLLNEAATRLRALGRLREAVEPLRATLTINEKSAEWHNCAVVASNLSELELTLGDVAAAVVDAEQSVDFADRSGDAFQRMVSRTKLADVRHQAGEEGAALELFLKAESLQAERQPQYPLLYSLQGFHYCDLLLAPAERAAGSGRDARAPRGECDEVERRAAQALEIVLKGSRNLLDIALNHLNLGRARLYRAILEGRGSEGYAGARDEIEKAVAGLRAAGQLDDLPRGLLTRAWLRFAQGDAAGAQADLDEAYDIAERGSMRLHLADVALYRARFFHDRAALVKAKRLVEECGYGRRREEIKDLEKAAVSWPQKSTTKKGRKRMKSPAKRFQVALSFAGEHRAYVEEVATHLASSLGQDRVLYDQYYAHEFARPDLDTYLQGLYHDESELIVVFLSADYERKEWCGLEWRAIRDLIKKRQPETVMPLRFDMTEIPGLFSGDGYLWLGNRQPAEVAELILKRLNLPKAKVPKKPAPAPTPASAPPAARPSAALEMWRKKLDHLLAQEPITVDPDAKFRLQALIDEARQKIREHGGAA